MGGAGKSCIFVVWFEELVGEIFLRYMEYDTGIFVWLVSKERNNRPFEDVMRTISQLK